MKATLKGRYEVEKSATAVMSLAGPAAGGDLRVKATATDATFGRGPSMEGLVLSLEKPGHFMVDLNVPNKDVRFQFMNSAKVLDKTVNLTYTHSWKDNRTAVDCGLVFDPSNKVSVNYMLGAPGGRIKYVYSHGIGRKTTVEPCFDTAKNAWDFAVSRKFETGDAIKATYQTSSKVLGLEWSRDSTFSSNFRILASFNLAEQNKAPKVVAESTWNCNL